MEVREVPADDLDGAVGVMLRAVADLSERFPEARLVADYTGGTKTMTAALVVAALESERVALRLVTGTRGDLVKVHDGSQSGLDVSAEAIGLRRAMAPYLAAWGVTPMARRPRGWGDSPSPVSRDCAPTCRPPATSAVPSMPGTASITPRRSPCARSNRARLGPVFGRGLTVLEILAAPEMASRRRHGSGTSGSMPGGAPPRAATTMRSRAALSTHRVDRPVAPGRARASTPPTSAPSRFRGGPHRPRARRQAQASDSSPPWELVGD